MILSFGLLGIAGLLLASAGQQKNSQGYVMGNLLAQDIIERMKANPSDLANMAPLVQGDNYTTQTNWVSYGSASTSVPAGTTCALGSTCPAGSVARNDLNTWLARVRTELPGGAGMVVVPTDAEPQTRQVLVMWTEKDSNQTENSQSAVRADTVNCPAAVRAGAPSTLRCVTVVMKP
jgi:type IV pilus assembly protein PilV